MTYIKIKTKIKQQKALFSPGQGFDTIYFFLIERCSGRSINIMKPQFGFFTCGNDFIPSINRKLFPYLQVSVLKDATGIP